jgi:tetratricopeptide (TPR) repeat protein/energy-coupling factor transporter ATP-binding protein EcfA2
LRYTSGGIHQNSTMSRFKIFLSSPSDVLPERDRAQEVIERLNAESSTSELFSLSRWEHAFYHASSPPQGQIPNPGDHDIVICIFWKRIGTDLPPAYDRPDGTSRTGTEYEFEEAREARERRQDGHPDILVYRKTAKVLFSEEDVDEERAQKKALDHFWERWFRSDAGHFIAGFQAFADTDDFGVQLERNLREWLRRRRSGLVFWDIATRGSPYRGLVAFDEDHAALFFGRKRDVARARARFIDAAIGRYQGSRSAAFLLILGPSGCGKSSFLRAGLIPQLRSGAVPSFLDGRSGGIHSFRSVVVVPRELGSNLIRGLATALYHPEWPGSTGHFGLPELAAGDYATVEAFEVLAANSPASAVAPVLRALERARAAAHPAAHPGEAARVPTERMGLILAIDQLEELFSNTTADRQAFVQLLTELASSGSVWVTATVRNDFYDRLRHDRHLSELTDRGRIYDLGPPNLADFRAIIREPAAAAGLEFETTEGRDLAAEIEKEAAGDGSLPMIAFLLDELFQNRRGELLTLETYDRLGGAAGALAAHGEQLFAALPAADQQAFPRVVRRLVRLGHQDQGPVAAPAPPSAFPPDSPERRLIGALSEARLVHMFTVTEDQSETSWVRWSHEALLRRWPRLRASVEADRRDYETLDRLQTACSLWHITDADQQHSRLLTDLALAEGLDLIARWGADIDEEIRQFVFASKFAAQARRRRRRRVVTGIVAALTALCVVSIVMGLSAARQGRRARSEATIADRTTQFMVSLFSLADPTESSDTAAALKSVLDRSAGEIQIERHLEPRVRAELRSAIGRAYAGLGRYSDADRVLEEALRDQQQSEEPVPAESRVRTMAALGSAQYSNSDYDRSVEQLRQAVDLARRSLPPSSAVRSEALTSLADALSQQGQTDLALNLCDEALQADRARGPGERGVLAQTLDTLSRVYLAADQPAKAVDPMHEALDLRRAVFGTHHARTAESMNNLGALYYQLGRYAEAAQLWSDALPVYKEVYGDVHVEVATILNNLGRSALMAGHVKDAETLLRDALALDEKLRSPTHDDLIAPLSSLAMIDLYNGRSEIARAEIARAQHIARLPDHGELLDQVLLNAADVELATGHRAQAAALLAESRNFLEKSHPQDQGQRNAWRYAIWNAVNARLLAAEGNTTEARRVLSQACEPIVRRFGQNGFYTVQSCRRGAAALTSDVP